MTRFKPVPPAPDDLDAVATAHRAVPLVPGTEADCCARVRSALDLPARDDARAWLTFLRALGLVRETEAGYVRVRERDDGESGGDHGESEGGDAAEDDGAGDDAAGGDGAGGPLQRETLVAAFRERVFGAREVLAALEAADGPLSADAAFGRVRGMVPEWERHRDPAGWEDRWRGRVERLLGWAAVLGLAEQVDGGYRHAAGGRGN